MCLQLLLHCALSAAQCIVIGPVCLFMGVWVDLLPRKLEIACIDFHQTGFVGKGSDHLPGKGVCGGRIFLATLYYSQRRAVFASLSALFSLLILLCSAAQLYYCTVRENVCNNSKKVKSHVFWILKKT